MAHHLVRQVLNARLGETWNICLCFIFCMGRKSAINVDAQVRDSNEIFSKLCVT